MQSQITILTSELSEMHPAYKQRSSSNTLYHIINRRTTKRISSVVQKDGEWCEVRGDGGFRFEYDLLKFHSQTSCIKHVLAQQGIQYDEVSENEKSGITGIQKTKKSQRDEFGFLVNSKVHLFCEQLAAAGSQGITMDDARNAEWNTGKASFFGAMKKLVNDGKAIKKGRRMYLLSATGEKSLAPVKSKSKPVAIAVAAAPVKTKIKPVPVVSVSKKSSKPKPV